MGLIFNKKITNTLLFCCVVAAFGTTIYGWEVGMMNIIFSMKATFGIKFGLYEFKGGEIVETYNKNFRESIIPPTFTLGCVFGTLLAYALLDKLGRVMPLIVSSIVFVIGCILQTVSNGMWMFCISRVISGVACGATMVTSPVYVAEICPKDVRGTMGMITTLGLQVGILFSSLADTISLKVCKGDAQWRVAVGCQLIPAVLFLAVVWFAKESPRYLLMKKKDEKAMESLSSIREKPSDDKEVLTEYDDMRKVIIVEREMNTSKWSEIYHNKSYLIRVIIASIIQFLHMFIGINAINYYSSQVYDKYLGIELKKWGAWLVVLNNLVVLVVCLFASKYVEKVGRRPLLVWGAFVLAIFMFLVFFFCFIIDIAPSAKFLGWGCVVAIYFFTIIYTWTWSAAVFVWQAEIFPNRVRSKANTVAIFFQYVGSAIVTSGTTILMKYFKYYTFLFFTAFCIIAFVFSFCLVKETKGRTLEQMEELYGKYNKNNIEVSVTEKKQDIEETNVKEC